MCHCFMCNVGLFKNNKQLRGISDEHLNGFTIDQPWIYRFIVYAALGYIFSFLINFIELNCVAKKVIRDLIRDIQR